MRGRGILIVIGVIVLIVILLGALAGAGGMGYGMMGLGGVGEGAVDYQLGPGRLAVGWWIILMGTMMLLFWGLVIGGLVWLIVWLTRQARATGPEPGAGPGRALEILRERYARGEITREQYEQMRSDLEGRGG